MSTLNRRWRVRVDVAVPLDVRIVGTDGAAVRTASALVTDLSTGGASIRTTEAIVIGTAVELKFGESELPLPEAVRGRVQHTRSADGEHVHGVVFDELDIHTRATLARCTFSAAKRAGIGAGPATRIGGRSRPVFDPGSLESVLRYELLPLGQQPIPFVDDALVDAIVMIADGDEHVRAKYPQAAAIYDRAVKEAARRLKMRRPAGPGSADARSHAA